MMRSYLISTDKLMCICSYDGEEVRLMLWDTAGQEEFDAITKAYYRGLISDKIGSIRSTKAPLLLLVTEVPFSVSIVYSLLTALFYPN